MILRILLLLVYILIEVSGNPILQPSQQCSYQPTAYRNQQLNIPIILQQPATSILPYTQSVIAQNQLAPSYQNYEPYPLSDDLVLFESIQNVQPILDPSYLNYGQNGFESQILNVPNYRVPNVVNNYIIVPPTCCECNGTLEEERPKKISNGEKKIKRERKSRRKSGSQNIDNEPKSSATTASTLKTIERSEQSVKLEENQGQSRKRKRNKKLKEDSTLANETETNHQQTKRDERQKKKPGNRPAETQNNDVLEVNQNQLLNQGDIVQNNNPRKRRRKSKSKNNNGDALTDLPLTLGNNEVKDTANIAPSQAEQKNKSITVSLDNQKNIQPTQNSTDPNQNAQVINLPYKTVSNQERGNYLQEKNSNLQERIVTSMNFEDNNNPQTKTVNDFNDFPSVPPEMQNIMSFMKNFNGQQFGNSDMFANYPFNYDQMYQGLQSTDTATDTNRKRRRKRPRRPQNRKRKGDQNKTEPNQTVTTTTVVETIKTTTEMPVISHKEPSIEERLQSDFESNIESTTTPFEEIPMEVPFNIQSPSTDENKFNEPVEKPNSFILELNEENISYVNGHGDVISDVGKEDEKHTEFDNEYFYDYYPDFTDSAGFFANNNEYYVRHPTDHYLYNRDIDIDILNKERRRYDRRKQNLKPNFVENVKILRQLIKDPKRTEYIVYKESNEEVTTAQSIIEENQRPKAEEILFKTPPALEFPDFKTQKVNKDYTKQETIAPYFNFNDHNERDIYSDDFVEKSSIYSDVKTPMYNTRAKPNKHDQNPKTTGIETVFVNSKVVKYGQQTEQSKVETTSKNNERDKVDDVIVTEDGTTIVVADSLGYPEGIWYT